MTAARTIETRKMLPDGSWISEDQRPMTTTEITEWDKQWEKYVYGPRRKNGDI